MQPELVIFDCDGVLVDSEPIEIAVVIAAAAEVGLSLGTEEVAEHWMGRSWAEWSGRLEPRLGAALAADFITRLRRETLIALESRVRPVEGIHDVLDALITPCCVASNAPEEKMRLTLRACRMLERFDGRMFSAYAVANPKPAPDIYLHAAAALGVTPENCVVVEDSLPGVQAGIAAGMRVLGYSPVGNERRLASAGVPTFARMADLLRLVAGE